jgi:uncharacterized protein (TIGR03382 family)
VSGAATVTYTDGSTQAVTLGLSDWTLAGGGSQPGFGNTVAATMPVRVALREQCLGGSCGALITPDHTTSYLLSAAIPVDPARTVASLTLPSPLGGAQMHVFAVATSDVAPPANVSEAPWAPILPLVGASVWWAVRRRRAGAPDD